VDQHEGILTDLQNNAAHRNPVRKKSTVLYQYTRNTKIHINKIEKEYHHLKKEN
jgi:hypothetical protein